MALFVPYNTLYDTASLAPSYELLIFDMLSHTIPIPAVTTAPITLLTHLQNLSQTSVSSTVSSFDFNSIIRTVFPKYINSLHLNFPTILAFISHSTDIDNNNGDISSGTLFSEV